MADSENDIVIRPFDTHKDLKEVQLLIGMSSMEQLAVANRLAYSHPVAISIWLVCAGALIQLLRAWPDGSGPHGWLGYLAPLPILACTALPVLFGIDWLHRPLFEDMLKTNVGNFTKSIAVQNNDTRSINSLYFVVEYKSTPIGYAFVRSITSASQKATHFITGFHVDAPYRRAGVGNDLLKFVAKSLGNSKCEIVSVTTHLTPYTSECLEMAGFSRSGMGVEVWGHEKKREEVGSDQDEMKVDLSDQKVLLVDTRPTGWVLKLPQ